MKSIRRSPDGGSSVAPNTKIEPCEAVFCAWWATASTPIQSFHTVSEGEFSEVHNPLRTGIGESPGKPVLRGPGIGPLIDLRHEALGLAWRPHVVGVVLALRQLEWWLRLVLVGDAGEQVGDGVQPRPPLVVCLDDPPGG